MSAVSQQVIIHSAGEPHEASLGAQRRTLADLEMTQQPQSWGHGHWS